MSDQPARKPATRIVCGGCGHTWTAAGAAHCGGCHRTFAGMTLFDRHRSARGERGACINPELLDGMELREGMWRGPELTDDQKLARFGAS